MSIPTTPGYAGFRSFRLAARIEEAWWNYNGGRFRQEVALAKSLHANCIRLWIEFTAWMADPDRVTERFLDAVKAIDEQGMKTMPVLFNRLRDQNGITAGSTSTTWAATGAPSWSMCERWSNRWQPTRGCRSGISAMSRMHSI